ncbi:hypothetical protein C1645_765496 [Glomus cerebriforme]|uniref:Uncharacterized protein n=1 Tax=Glomus cerebriforme TaxID=658196 RepID=A0A397T1F9_9GLOM|nr:hypothetical protein C1645_765496 [Glomus cerebriforme]
MILRSNDLARNSRRNSYLHTLGLYYFFSQTLTSCFWETINAFWDKTNLLVQILCKDTPKIKTIFEMIFELVFCKNHLSYLSYCLVLSFFAFISRF